MLKIKVAKVAKKGNTEEGKWLELPLWIDEIYEAVGITEEQYHNAEYVITALDCDEIDGLKISNFTINELNAIAERLEEVQDKTALSAIFEAIGYTNLKSIHECLDIYENDSYSFYKNMTGTDVVEEMLRYDLDMIPDIIRYHIDLEGIWNDLKHDGYFSVSNGIIRIDY